MALNKQQKKKLLNQAKEQIPMTTELAFFFALGWEETFCRKIERIVEKFPTYTRLERTALNTHSVYNYYVFHFFFFNTTWNRMTLDTFYHRFYCQTNFFILLFKSFTKHHTKSNCLLDFKTITLRRRQTIKMLRLKLFKN